MLVAGLAFGWAAYRLLDRVLLPAFIAAGYSPQATFLAGGFAAAILLVILSSGLGFPFAGIQLYLTICLFPFGWIGSASSSSPTNHPHRPRAYPLYCPRPCPSCLVWRLPSPWRSLIQTN